MSTLGLSGPEDKSEGRLKTLFWPTISNSHDVDLLGTQGFWLCQLVAAFTLIVGIATSHPWLALFTAAYFFLGGVGVREGSAVAAILLFLSYLLDIVASARMGIGGFGLIRFVILAILLANIRATFLAGKWWKNPSEHDDLEPMRFNETWRDKFCDQMPRVVWPKMRAVFWVLASLNLLMELMAIWAVFFIHPTGLD